MAHEYSFDDFYRFSMSRHGRSNLFFQDFKNPGRPLLALSDQIANVMDREPLPLNVAKAGATMLRKIKTARTSLLDSHGLVIPNPDERSSQSNWSPSQAEILQISTTAPLANHRWSGPSPLGQPGVGGSYWGTIHGVQAEDLWYNVKNVYAEPKSGLIDPRFASIVVQKRHQLEKNLGELPNSIPGNGGNMSDIVIGRLRRDVLVPIFHPGDRWFQDWNRLMTDRLRNPLREFGYDWMADALLDPENRAIARIVGNLAAGKGAEGVTAISARSEDMNWSTSYHEDLANNFVFYGEANESLADLIELDSVLEIRPHPKEGVVAGITPINDAYPAKSKAAILRGSYEDSKRPEKT